MGVENAEWCYTHGLPISTCEAIKRAEAAERELADLKKRGLSMRNVDEWNALKAERDEAREALRASEKTMAHIYDHFKGSDWPDDERIASDLFKCLEKVRRALERSEAPP